MLRCRAGFALGLLAVAATSVAAEPGTWWGARELPRQWRPLGDSRPTPPTGVGEEEIQVVTLKEAVALALEHNPRIAARRLEPLHAEAGVLQAQGVLDPTLSGEVLSRQITTPNQSALAQTRTVNIDDRVANLHLVKTLRSSTELSVDFLNERLDNNAGFNQLRPQYRPELGFSVLQPLLRGFGWDFTYLVVRVAEATADAAVHQYEADVADFVAEVIGAWWQVVRARENVEVQRESLALADRTVTENQARVRVGLLASVAVLEARADATSRKELVILAENDLAIARLRLAQLVYFIPDGGLVPRTLEPAPPPDPEAVEVDVDATLATALERRPEIHASARGLRARTLDERIAGNSLLPRLDLVGSYGVNGLSGGNRPVISNRNIPGARCVPLGGSPPTFSCNSPFAGSSNAAYDRLGSGDFRSYSFGLQFAVPLSNVAARGQHTASRIARRQAELSHRDLLSQVTLEVRESVSDVVTAKQRIETTRIARELAAENLRNQEKRHEVGLATTKDLLDFQTRLTNARAAEVRARADHGVALAGWRRAQGRLLHHYQIVVEQPGRRSLPWFARF